MLVQTLEASVTGPVPNLRSQNCRNRLSSASEVSRTSASNGEAEPEPEVEAEVVEVEVGCGCGFVCCVCVVRDGFEVEGPLPVPLLEEEGGGDRRLDL